MALDRLTQVRGGGIESPLELVGDLSGNNANFVGVITASTFSGTIVGNVVGVASTALNAVFADNAGGLLGTPDISVGSISVSNGIVAGVVTAVNFNGSGANLTDLNASRFTTGTLPNARFPAVLPGVSGSNLTDLDASNLSLGTVPDARFPNTLPSISGSLLTNLNASQLSSGTVPDARFPATLPAVSGANLTNLDAANISSGTLPDARFPATLPAVSGANLTNLPAGNLTGTISNDRLPNPVVKNLVMLLVM